MCRNSPGLTHAGGDPYESTIIFLARRNHIHDHCPIASRSDHLRLGSSCRRLDSTQMDKLGSFDCRWIPGVRRVTVSYQIETKLAANRKETPLNVIKDRGFLVIGFFPELHFSN